MNLLRYTSILATIGCLLLACSTSNTKQTGEVIEELSFKTVSVNDNFWRPRIDKNRTVGIWAALEEGRKDFENFDVAAGKASKENYAGGMANDSNVFKIIQGAAYALADTPDQELEDTFDSIIDRIVAAQQPDGYLFTYWIVNDLFKRWTDLFRGFELYCAGHLFEAAVAYHQATGKRKLLDAAIAYADHIDSVFGPGRENEVFSHEEIELGLYKLYKETGDKKYLDLSAFFIDERGKPERMTVDKMTPPDNDPNAGTPWRWRPPAYMQDHLPFTEQFYAVGHAVCATYLYSAVTDHSIEGETKYLPALDSIWNDIVEKKLYITGGIGTRQYHDEGFGSDFKLPEDSAYCETCANIGLTFWNRRMTSLHGESKYADLTELSMFNAALAGVSLSGNRFFYRNVLESKGKDLRRPWDAPPCCPTNVVRFLPEISSTIYGKRDSEIFINQFIGNEAEIEIRDQPISLKMETDYPWDGKISIEVYPLESVDLNLNIRIPGWARGELLPGNLYQYVNEEASSKEVSIKINGTIVNDYLLHKGYAVIERKWESGDVVELQLPMDIKMLKGNPRIEDVRGKVAISRGPLIYCFEEVDNEAYFEQQENLSLSLSDFETENRPNLLSGIVCINGKAVHDDSGKAVDITAIPYYAWNNRGPNNMKVWLQTKKN